MEIKKREDIPENRQVRLTVTVDRDTWQAALMHCYNGIKSLCPVEGGSLPARRSRPPTAPTFSIRRP